MFRMSSIHCTWTTKSLRQLVQSLDCSLVILYGKERAWWFFFPCSWFHLLVSFEYWDDWKETRKMILIPSTQTPGEKKRLRKSAGRGRKNDFFYRRSMLTVESNFSSPHLSSLLPHHIFDFCFVFVFVFFFHFCYCTWCLMTEDRHTAHCICFQLIQKSYLNWNNEIRLKFTELFSSLSS